MRHALLLIALVLLSSSLSSAKEGYINYFLGRHSLTLPLSASFAKPPASPFTINDEREFPRVPWADIRAVKAWVDGKYLAFRIEFESPIPSYINLYRYGVISFLIGPNNYTLNWIAIRHQALGSLKLNGKFVNTKIYFRVEDDTVSLFIPLKSLKLNTGMISGVKVRSGGGYVVRAGIRLESEAKNRSLSVKLNLLNMSEGHISLTYHGSYLDYRVLNSNPEDLSNVYLTLTLKQAGKLIKRTVSLLDASRGVYISGLEESAPVEVPYVFLYLMDSLPAFNLGLGRVMVKVDNVDDNNLRLELYMDGRLLKVDRVRAKSVKLVGTYLLSEGPHEIGIEWKDLDKRFESYKVIDVRGSVMNVTLRTRFYKWCPPRCGCRG